MSAHKSAESYSSSPESALSNAMPFLDGFRAIGIMMVVATHALEYTQLNSQARAVISFWVYSVAVSPFFITDGFLFARGQSGGEAFSAARYLAKSAKRLLIPWLVFSLLYALLRWAYECWGNPSAHLIVGESLFSILGAFYYSSFAAQLYFLLSLFLIRAIAPVTRYLLSLSRITVLVVFCGYVSAWYLTKMGAVELGIDPILLAFWGLQFYLLGVVLYLYHAEVVTYAHGLSAAALALLFAARAPSVALPVVPQFAYLLAVYFLIVALGSRERILAEVGRSTMGIYVLHAPVLIKVVSQIVALFLVPTGVTCYLVVSGGTLCLSLLLSKVLMFIPWSRRLNLISAR